MGRTCNSQGGEGECVWEFGGETIRKDRINGFSGFVHRPDSKELEDKNMTFRKLDLFPSSGEGRHLLCWFP
jgi:hypothetical protein